MWILTELLFYLLLPGQVLSHNLCTVMKIPHDPVALEEHFKDDDEGPVSNQGYMPYLNTFILDKVGKPRPLASLPPPPQRPGGRSLTACQHHIETSHIHLPMSIEYVIISVLLIRSKQRSVSQSTGNGGAGLCTVCLRKMIMTLVTEVL